MKVEYRFAIEVRFVHPDAYLPTEEIAKNVISSALLHGLMATGLDQLVSAELKPLRVHRKKDLSDEK